MELQPIFYDFEASGLEGFPIEIGWAWQDNSAVRSDSLLITPVDGWDIINNWDADAERIHGISIQQLKSDGSSALTVAQRLNHIFAGRTLYSDSSLDTKWMKQLFEAAGLRPNFRLHLMPAAELIDERRESLALPDSVVSQIAEQVDKLFPHTHRARADATYWAELWARFSRASEEIRADCYGQRAVSGAGRSSQVANAIGVK